MAKTDVAGMPPVPVLDRIRPFTPALLLVLLLLGISLAEPGFLNLKDLSVILSDASVLFVLAAGMTFVIMLGGIDLSVQAGASFASMVVAETLPHLGYVAFPVTILIGLLAGLCSGLVHVRLRIPSFIATLATGGIMTGLSLLMESGQSVALLETGRHQCRWITGSAFFGVPDVILIATLVAMSGLFIQRYTRFGRYSAAIGAGEPGARAAGIAVDRYKIMAFGFSGAFAALGGVLLAARLSSGSPDLANQLLLPTIAAVVVGGTAITGGIGNIGLTVVGTLIVSIVRIGMTFLGVDIFAQQIVFGVALVLAVFVTIDRSKIAIIK
jgi:ribose transport system permease protein